MKCLKRDDFLSTTECDDIIFGMRDLPLKPALIYEKGGDPYIDTSFCKSENIRLPKRFVNPIKNKIKQYIPEIKKSLGIKKELDTDDIDVVFIKYNKGCFFNTHRDTEDSTRRKGERGVTIILQLSSPSHYRGGRLSMYDGKRVGKDKYIFNNKRLMTNKRGSAIIFDSPALTPH